MVLEIEYAFECWRITKEGGNTKKSSSTRNRTWDTGVACADCTTAAVTDMSRFLFLFLFWTISDRLQNVTVMCLVANFLCSFHALKSEIYEKSEIYKANAFYDNSFAAGSRRKPALQSDSSHLWICCLSIITYYKRTRRKKVVLWNSHSQNGNFVILEVE